MPQETSSYEDFDVAAASAEVGADLFPSAEKPEPELPELDSEPALVQSDSAPSDPAAVTPNPVDPAIIPGQNSVASPLPKSWKKELAPDWEKTSPAVQQYVLKRESDMMRGIQQYQHGYQAWDNLIKPFAPLLEQNPNVNPIQLMQGLMQTHLQLLDPNAPSEQKAQLVNALLQEYGISLAPSDPNAPAPDAAISRELAELRAERAAYKREQETQRQSIHQAGVNNHLSVIEKFAADPANEYFNEVGNDILRFVQSGAATDLPSAYDLACWANPAVRAKMLAKQPASSAAVQNARDKKTGQFINVEPAVPSTRRPKTGTIDNTIDSIVAKHYTAH